MVVWFGRYGLRELAPLRFGITGTCAASRFRDDSEEGGAAMAGIKLSTRQ